MKRFDLEQLFGEVTVADKKDSLRVAQSVADSPLQGRAHGVAYDQATYDHRYRDHRSQGDQSIETGVVANVSVCELLLLHCMIPPVKFSMRLA